MSEEDPTILDAMLSGQIRSVHDSAKVLARYFQRISDFLEDTEEVKSKDLAAIKADVVRAKALAITPYYERFSRAVSAVRDITQEE